MVEPDVIAADPELHARFVAATEASLAAYRELLAGLEERFAGRGSATLRRKQARQAARAVLPNATETRIVVTGNYRAWRHFVAMRASEHADVEIRALAIACLRELQRVAPNVFADFEITALPDGTAVASSPSSARAESDSQINRPELPLGHSSCCQRRGQSADGSGEHLGVPVDVGCSRGRRHQRHVVERREQHAAVGQVRVQVVLELGIVRCGRFATGARRRAAEAVLHARAEPADRPGQAVLGDHRVDARRRTGRRASIIGGHASSVSTSRQRRAHGRQRDRVAGQRAADAAHVDQVEVGHRVEPCRQICRQSVGAAGNSPADRLADRDHVRRAVPTPG